MLLAQRPQTMGPTHSPGGLPFGYDINNPNGDPTIDNPEQLFANPGDLEIAGQSLLGQDGTDYLQSFFGGFQSDNLTSWGEGLGLHSSQWSGELLVGHELNFGVNPDNMLYQEPMQQYNSALPIRPHYASHGSNNFPPNPMGQPSADVLSAATALLPVSDQQSSHNSLQYMTSHAMGLPLHQETNSFNMFGANPGPSHSQQARPSRGVEVQFGSDPGFSNAQHFVPRHERESTEHIAAKQLATLSCLQRNHSNAPTRAPSPEPWAAASHPPQTTTNGVISPLKLKTSDLSPNPPQDDGSSSALKKRRRSDKSTDSDDEDEEQERSVIQETPVSVPSPLRSALSPPSAKRRKPSVAPSAIDDSTTPPANGKRKKSAAAKPPRENLSEAQKRENHIRSEQKRRNIIKDGFAKLNQIVPTVVNQSLSKAGVLIATHEWIDQLVKENKELEKLLASAGEKA